MYGQIQLLSEPARKKCQAMSGNANYGKKYMGIDRSTFLVSPDGKIAKIWRKVSVPGHVEEVLEAVKALGA
jgi:peroxiredoxin Q/BCP